MSNKLIFITDNINELLIQDRREILQILYNSPSRSKLNEKGGGTQIKLNDLSEQLVEKIYNYITIKLSSPVIDLF
jgi:hypothetical protein